MAAMLKLSSTLKLTLKLTGRAKISVPALTAVRYLSGDKEDIDEASNTDKDGIPVKPRRFPKPLRTPQFGVDILHDPLWNKVHI
jgi:hypothetical protein